jgi:hypothetical protein
VRRGLLRDGDARSMARREHGGGFFVDGSVRIEADKRCSRIRNTVPSANSMMRHQRAVASREMPVNS